MLELLQHPQPLVWFLAIGGITSIAFAVLRGRRNTRGLPLPPGPKGLPLLGNIFQIPSEKPWKVYNEWGKVYGKIATFVSTIGTGPDWRFTSLKAI
jgi:hypothetical protein